MKKYSIRFLSILLTACMLLVGFPTQVFAEAVSDGNPGYTLTYTANGDSTASITGLSIAEGFEESELKVEIPETIDGMTVTKIAGSSWSTFVNCNITSIYIPATVTEIGAGAFRYCRELTQVTFAEGSAPGFEDAYHSNSNGVFAECTALTSIELPAGTTKLGTYMFDGCESLTTVNLSELTQITTIPFRAFDGCALSSVTLPANVKTVETEAFAGNHTYTGDDKYDTENWTYTIKNITLNEGLTEIKSDAFSNNKAITSLVLPNTLTTLGKSAFWGCEKLSEITWPDNKEFTEINGFEYCNGLPDSIFDNLPATVTSIGEEAFYGCRFTRVSLPGTVEKIGERAFARNMCLKTLELREGLQSIGVGAFAYCNGTDPLTGEYTEGLLNATIVVPKTVTYIGVAAFSVPYNSAYADDANPGLTLKILNPDLKLKDENEDDGFIQIISGVAYATIYGDHYKSDGVTESDLYAYVQYLIEQSAESSSCSYTWKNLSDTPQGAYTVSGTVTPADASIIVEKGGEKSTYNTTTDGSGSFSFPIIYDENVKVTFSADGYFNRTFMRAAGRAGNWNFGNVELTPLPVNRTVAVSLSDSEGKSLYSFDGLTFTLKAGENTLKENTDYTLQFPYIILNDTVSVTKDTTLTLSAETDESLKRSGATATTTLDRPKLNLVLPAWGNVTIPTVSKFVGGHNVLIFDSEGKLAEYGTVSSTIMEETYSYTGGKLKAGSYTAVIFNQNKYISVIPTLSDLTSCGMTEDTDYKKTRFTVRDGKTTTVDTVTVPVLDTGKFGTIVDTDYSCVRLDENSPITGVKFRARVFYGFADEAVASGKLTINIPSDAIVSYVGNENGRLDAESASNGYTKSGNTLTIPVSRNKGVVFMDLTISGTGNRIISAALSDGTETSPLGSCAFDCYTTRLTLPSEFFESRNSVITASIKAKPQTKVDIYMDGEKKGEVTTDKLGNAYYDFTPPEDASIGKKLSIYTQTAEGDGVSAVIRNMSTNAAVKEFYFVQHNRKYYVVEDGTLTKDLSYSYYYIDVNKDDCKDWSFSATINATTPLDEDLTSLTITMKNGDVMDVPLYLSGAAACDDGSTDYVFTGTVTLEHPGVKPNYFNNSKIPVRLDLSYSNIIDESLKEEWAQQEYNGTQTLMAELTANTLSDEEVEEIQAQYENPWTPEFIADYSKSLEDCLADFYCHIEGVCVDPDNPTDAELAAAKSAVKGDVEKLIKRFTTTDEEELGDMANMLFGDEYMVEIDDEILAYAETDEQRQWAREYQSAMLNLENSVDNYCDYLSAAWLLDKNVTDYEDGLEIAEEVGITLAPELAEQVRAGTLKNVTVDKVEQAEGSDIVYAYDKSGNLIYTIDTSKQLEKVLAHKDAIDSGNVNAAMPGSTDVSVATLNSAYDSEEPAAGGGDSSLALTADTLETVNSWVGGFWIGNLGTGMEKGAEAMKLSANQLARLSDRIGWLSEWNKDWWLGKKTYVDKSTYDMFMKELDAKQIKYFAATKVAPYLEPAGKAIGAAGTLIGTGQVANDVVDIWDKNNEIENWEQEVEQKEKLYYHYMKLQTKDCESFPTKFKCGDALMQCTNAGRKLASYNEQLRNFSTVDAVANGLAVASSFIPGLGWGVGFGISAAGALYGKAADGAKTELQKKITENQIKFYQGEKASKKYCKIQREDCPDDDSNSDNNGLKTSGNSGLGSGNIGSDLLACLDPAGVVYEAVESNPLSGVNAELWYSADKDGSNAVIWDAENYGGQINPQITDADGMYSWYVPDGYWKVKFTKDGYNTAETEWMEVPPPRLDVNVGLISTASPTVQSINAYPDYVEIIFTQYMSVTEALTVGDGYTYEWADKTPVNEESSIYYSKILRLIPKDKAKIGDTVSVTVDGAENYAGTSLSKYSSGSLTVVPRPAKLVLNYEDKISVHMGENPIPGVTVRVLDSEGNPIPDLKVSAAASGDLYASVSSVNDVTGEDGIATFSVEGQLPGTTRLMLSVENTSLSTDIPLVITNTENRPERPTAQIGDIALTASSPKENFVTVRSGETMALSCASDDAVIYYTTDGTCPCQNTASRMKYTGPITITENTKFRIAAYKEGMDYSERLNITVTVDDTHRHSFGDQWKSDENCHWHECTCGAVSDRADHDWKIENAKEATATESGYTGDKICKVCGYTVKGEEIPVTGTTEPTYPTNPGGNTPTEPIYSDGNTQTEPTTGQDESKPTNPDGAGNKDNYNPQTGDNGNVAFWFVLMAVSVLGIGATLLYGRKRKGGR